MNRSQAIEYARGLIEIDACAGSAFICHGRPYCNANNGKHTMICPFCHVVAPEDPRSNYQIERDIEKQIRGH